MPAVVAGLVLTLTLSACSGSEPQTTNTGSGQQQSGGGQTPQAAKVTVKPAGGAQDVAPGEPAQITVADGTIGTVTLTNPDGKQVKGELSADKKSWTVAEQLGYGKTYTWAGDATGADGKKVDIAGAFTTVKPKKQVQASINVGDGQEYGVAMPIVLSFKGKVADKQSVEKALKVETTPKTEGSWAWLEGDTAVHWRPKEYYKSGTTVKVEAKLYGVKFADGTYGKEDVTADFKIGRKQIVTGNTTEHTMQVIREGQQIAEYPVSYGLDSDPGRVTKSGTHVVMGKQASYAMSNPRYGYENVVVPWAVRISNNGEFIHGLAASIWAQGKKNVSHGCLNLAPKNAKEYFDGTMTGDPVEISGSTQKLTSKDGDYSDWTYTWEEWTKLSALNS
ncbi:Ig-like domain-containing protein [Amycolatopsis sp. cg5]|uniref:L,D-transpeptidase n=1 Tax=Amycolatopsis sp. cg5 TaxID=3238802 RepID=UPI003524F4D9